MFVAVIVTVVGIVTGATEAQVNRSDRSETEEGPRLERSDVRSFFQIYWYRYINYSIRDEPSQSSFNVLLVYMVL